MKAAKELNIKNVMNFYMELKRELETSSEIIIDLSETTRIDASAAQVIHAAKKKAKSMNKNFLLHGTSPELKRLLFLAGL
ncbi:MAG: STAS domain protein [Spirochaetes bacterium ADurb.Bin218]|jgi:anti-anti-sigma factor|nr:MAG: STAS domain protein [Spirochaetes bacterium ADurb.Bin218]HOV10086.1 STAS domain-containing protein [Spirochaetota bacterium]